MMRTFTWRCVLTVAVLLVPVAARAQLPARAVLVAPEWFAGAAVGVTMSSSGDEFPGNPSILRPEIGGTALEAVFTAGAFVTPHVGFAGEFTVPRAFDVHQTWGRDATTWDNEHRDLSLVGLVLVRTSVGRAQLAGAFGAGNVWSRTTTVRRSRRFGEPPTAPPFGTGTSTRHITDLALVAGAELNAPLASRVSLVPYFRLLIVPRSADNSFEDQLPTYLYHVGIGLRLWFR